MKIIMLLLLALLPALAAAQAGPPSVLVAQGTNCPTGWEYSERAPIAVLTSGQSLSPRVSEAFDGRVRPEVSRRRSALLNRSGLPLARDRRRSASGVLRHTPAEVG